MEIMDSPTLPSDPSPLVPAPMHMIVHIYITQANIRVLFCSLETHTYCIMYTVTMA